MFDTVGTQGFPEEFHLLQSEKDIKKKNAMRTLFGFPDCILGAHIEKAFHAIAINEVRLDFVRDFIAFTQEKFAYSVLGSVPF